MTLNHTAPADFMIASLPIHGRVILAPMDGLTDAPFRQLARSFGSAISISEFINAIDVVHGHPHLESQVKFSETERPFAYQVFDDKPDRLLKAAITLSERGPDYIDVNMGCSARNVSNRGAGSGLLKQPAKIAQIMDSLIKNIALPITAKIRLGWDDDSLNYLEVAHILEESGASLIAVHARTRKMEYSGEARWEAIAAVKQAAHIPVIGNGDVKSLDDARRMIDLTGCDAVMIGRAAIGNPWVFAGEQRTSQTREELFRVVILHLRAMVAHYGEKIGVLLFRKHLVRYLDGFLSTPEIRREIFSYVSIEPLMDQIERILIS